MNTLSWKFTSYNYVRSSICMEDLIRKLFLISYSVAHIFVYYRKNTQPQR